MGRLRAKVLIPRLDSWKKTVKRTSFKMSLFFAFPKSLCCVWWVDTCQAVDIQNWNKKAFRRSGTVANPGNPHTMHLLPAGLWPKTPVGATDLFSTDCLPLILNLNSHVVTGLLDFCIALTNFLVKCPLCRITQFLFGLPKNQLPKLAISIQIDPCSTAGV